MAELHAEQGAAATTGAAPTSDVEDDDSAKRLERKCAEVRSKTEDLAGVCKMLFSAPENKKGGLWPVGKVLIIFAHCKSSAVVHQLLKSTFTPSARLPVRADKPRCDQQERAETAEGGGSQGRDGLGGEHVCHWRVQRAGFATNRPERKVL